MHESSNFCFKHPKRLMPKRNRGGPLQARRVNVQSLVRRTPEAGVQALQALQELQELQELQLISWQLSVN
jgi:hypothetical protein